MLRNADGLYACRVFVYLVYVTACSCWCNGLAAACVFDTQRKRFGFGDLSQFKDDLVYVVLTIMSGNDYSGGCFSELDMHYSNSSSQYYNIPPIMILFNSFMRYIVCS